MWRLPFALSLAAALSALASTSAAPDVPQTEARTDVHGLPLPEGAVARLGSPQFRHNGPALGGAFTSNGKAIISVGADKVLARWSVDHGKEEFRLSIPALATLPAPVNQIQAMLANGNRIQLQELMVRQGESGQITVLSGNGQRLASVAKNSVLVFDTSTGKEIKRLPAMAPVTGPLTLSTDGTRLALAELEGGQQVLRIWDLAQNKEIQVLKLPEDAKVSLLRFSPDGRSLGGMEPPFVRVWDLATGKRTRLYHWNKAVVKDFQFSHDGKHLVMVGNGANSVRIWEKDSDEEAGKVQSADAILLHALFLPGDGNLLTFSHDRQFRVWNWNTGVEIRSFPGPARDLSQVFLSPQGKTVAAVCCDGSMQLFDLGTGQEKLTPRLPPLVDVDFQDSGKILLGRELGAMDLGDFATGKISNWFTPPENKEAPTASFVNLRNRAVAYWENGEKLHIALVRNGKLEPQVKNLENVHQVIFSPDGLLAATAQATEAGRVIQVYRVHGGKVLCQLEVPFFEHLLFTADGRSMVLGLGGSFSIWEIATGNQRAEFKGPPGELTALALSPDGRFLASGGRDETVRLWDLQQGKALWGSVRHEGAVTALAFTGDGKKLLSGGEDGVLRVWDTAAGKETSCFRGHSGGIRALAFSPDGRRLASASLDTTVLVWDLNAKQNAPGLAAKVQGLEGLWTELEKTDAAGVFAAMNEMNATPQATIAFLREKLTPAPGVKVGHIEQLIAALDHVKYLERDRAAKELQRLDMLAEPLMVKALATQPSPETAKRLEYLMRLLDQPLRDPALLRQQRAVEVLERIGTSGAQDLLDELGRGASAARLTRLAREAAARLQRRIPAALP